MQAILSFTPCTMVVSGFLEAKLSQRPSMGGTWLKFGCIPSPAFQNFRLLRGIPTFKKVLVYWVCLVVFHEKHRKPMVAVHPGQLPVVGSYGTSDQNFICFCTSCATAETSTEWVLLLACWLVCRIYPQGFLHVIFLLFQGQSWSTKRPWATTSLTHCVGNLVCLKCASAWY